MNFMKRFLILIIKLAGLVGLLITGSIAIHLIESAKIHRYIEYGAGYRYGSVNLMIRFEDIPYFIHIEGETEPQWYWTPNQNYAYQKLNIVRSTNGVESDAVIDLASFEFIENGKTVSISKFNLKNLMPFESNTTEAEVLELYDFLLKAKEGKLPPPRHHTYRLEEPLNGYMQHFSLGLTISYYVIAWGILWFIFLVCFVRKKMKYQTRIRESGIELDKSE